MKKLLLLFITLLLISCSKTINQPFFSKKLNPKQTIKLKYGEPKDIWISEGFETWIYNNKKNLKSNRIVVFDNNGKIIKHEKELKDLTWVLRNTLRYGGGLTFLAFLFLSSFSAFP